MTLVLRFRYICTFLHASTVSEVPQRRTTPIAQTTVNADLSAQTVRIQALFPVLMPTGRVATSQVLIAAPDLTVGIGLVEAPIVPPDPKLPNANVVERLAGPDALPASGRSNRWGMHRLRSTRDERSERSEQDHPHVMPPCF